MTWTADDVMVDRADRELGYEQEVRCCQCGEGFMTCPCGGELEAI